MADAAPAAADGAAPPAMGNLFDTYTGQGALGGLFAPAYISGFAPSEKAVAAWQAQNRGLTDADVEATRMPAEWRDPTAGVTSPGGMGPYGAGRIPNNMTLTGSGGTVDPVALKILAQGGHYDMASRRDAIAQRLAANSAAQSAYDTARARPVSPYGMQQYDFPMPYAGGQ